jgi:tight adherence protein B
MSELVTYLIYAGIFLSALLVVEGSYYTFFADRESRKAVNRRMRLVERGDGPAAVLAQLRRKTTPATVSLLENPIGWFEHMLEQADVQWSAYRVLLVASAATVALFLVALSFGPGIAGNTLIVSAIGCGILALGVGVGGTAAIIAFRRAKRMKLFGQQLPDALDIMVRSLRSGHPIAAAMNLVTKEMPDPIGTEFGLAVDEMTYGLDLRDALANLGDRVGLQEYDYVIAAINTQHETGGNLAEVLATLSQVLRDRFRMRKKVKALSSEGRMSAYVLSALPPFTVTTILLTTPDYYNKAVDDPLFWLLMGLAVGMLLTGVAVMYRMVKFRV